MVFLEISQNWQENACARVSFIIKLQALGDNKTWENSRPEVFCEKIFSKLY